MKKINVLICDDSALMRRSLAKIIEADPALSVAGIARDGEDAIVKARDLRPDVITMDINMPGLDGITALQHIMAEEIAPVIMVSSLTQEGATATFQAMALGAFDFVAKPGGTVSVNLEIVAGEIQAKIRAASGAGILKKLLRKKEGCLSRGNLKGRSEKVSGRSLQSERIKISKMSDRISLNGRSERENATLPSSNAGHPIVLNRADSLGFKAIALGVSTGGPKTLYDVLPKLPRDINAAVILVQHMPAKFIASFAKRIDENCHMRCVEVEAGMEIEPGTIYIAKGGHHLTLYRKLSKKIVVRTPTRPEHLFIPSVDVMMQSVLEVFGKQTVGVLMTGMGDDGAQSMVDITRAGCPTIAESEESAIVYGMPREAIERGGARIVAASWDIAGHIIRAVK